MLNNNYNKTLTNSIKKKLQSIFKNIGYSLSKAIYGKINGVKKTIKNPSIEIVEKALDKNYLYKIYIIKNCRLYTDTVNDAAFIIKDKIIEGPSYQYRSGNFKGVRNADIFQNIVFNKGTARLKKKINGTVLSLLTGGAGNSNYWHWLFDVLPRLKILDNHYSFSDIDYFLFPDIDERFQKETIELLNIPNSKLISSKVFRHIEAKKIISVDHPYVFKNNPTLEIQNIPDWILNYLKDKFLKNNQEKKFPQKFYIDRSDSKSNHRHLRKIINENEVKNYLIEKGFAIIALSELSFLDQINLFYNAKQIVGLHGAGFANIIFSKPKTFVLEFKSEATGQVIGNLAKKIGLNFEEMSIKPKENLNNDQQGIIYVPLKDLENKLINI